MGHEGAGMESAKLTPDQYEILFGERPPGEDHVLDLTADTKASETDPVIVESPIPVVELAEQAPTGKQPTDQAVTHHRFESGYIVGHRGPNHSLHAVISLMTLGLWLPVWAIIAKRNKQKPIFG